MSRVYNFSAGPAVLPEEVLKEVAEEMMDYQGSGMSVMEMSHRSADFQKIIDEAEQDLRDLMKIPDNYKVLFLQGGASQQFAAIPMNLMKTKNQKVTDCKTKNGTVALMKFIFNCCNSPIYNIYNPLLFFLVLCLYISTCLLAADKLIPLFHHIASTFRAFLC